MYSLPQLRNASFLFSQSISATEWKVVSQPVIDTLEPGDFEHYFSHESWRELDVTNYHHAIQHQFDLPLYLRKQGGDLFFDDPVAYQVGFEYRERRSTIVTRRAYPFAGSNPIFNVASLLPVPPPPPIARPLPVIHGIERRNGYFKFNLHYQQRRIHHSVACRHQCALAPQNDLVDIYVQVIYTRRR